MVIKTKITFIDTFCQLLTLESWFYRFNIFLVVYTVYDYEPITEVWPNERVWSSDFILNLILLFFLICFTLFHLFQGNQGKEFLSFLNFTGVYSCISFSSSPPKDHSSSFNLVLNLWYLSLHPFISFLFDPYFFYTLNKRVLLLSCLSTCMYASSVCLCTDYSYKIYRRKHLMKTSKEFTHGWLWLTFQCQRDWLMSHCSVAKEVLFKAYWVISSYPSHSYCPLYK